MKEIRLNRIVLANWKSLNIDVTLTNTQTKISGANGIGKSSLQAAWNWLLSNYTNAIVPKNHELFDNRVELTHETPVASVKVWITIDGTEYTLERTAQAKFTRKRGTNEYVKDSADSYKVFVDEIETSATNFAQWVEVNICPTEMLVYCLDGTFFTTLAEDDKKKARKVLETIVGEIKESDFSGDYSVLADDFAKGYTVEQIEERTKSQIKPLRERMDKIPALVEDKEKTLSEYMQIDYTDLERQIADKKKTIEDIDNAILGKAEAIKPILGKRDAIFEIINSKTLSLNERRNAYLNAFNAVRNEIKGKIDGIKTQNEIINRTNAEVCGKYDNAVRELETTRKELKNCEDFRKYLLEQRDEIKGRMFTDDKCAYCGQELPLDKLTELQTKFNEKNKRDLEFVVNQGKTNNEKIAAKTARIEELEQVVAMGVPKQPLKDATEYEQQLQEIEKDFTPYEQTNEYAQLSKEIDELKATLPEIPQNDNDALTNTKKTLINALELLNRQYGKKDKVDELNAEIDGLKCELQQLGVDVIKLEGKLAKCSEYREEKADIISFRVNDKLTDCKIQMWERQKNGDLIPSCIITDSNGVKYSTLNNSNRIKTCISLQQLFCRHYAIELPVFIDEAAIFSAKNLPVPTSQTIYLYASDSPTLCVE